MADSFDKRRRGGLSNPYTLARRVPWGNGTGRGPAMSRAGDARVRGRAVLLALSLIWLAGMLWSAHADITGTGDPVGALIQMAGALVGAVGGGLILVGYGTRSSIVVLAVSVLIAGALGGALALVPPTELV